MAIKISDLDEKIAFAEIELQAAFAAFVHGGDVARMMELKLRLFGLKRLRADHLAATQPSKARKGKTGPEDQKFKRVIAEMRRDRSGGADLSSMKQEEMASRYTASRGTCVKARNAILYPHLG